MGKGYHIEPALIEERISTLTKLGDLTGDLVTTASRLAERLPMLGTAPPAVHLAMRLGEAAGWSGLTGDVEGAQREIEAFQRTLSDAKAAYDEQEVEAGSAVRTAGEHHDRRRS